MLEGHEEIIRPSYGEQLAVADRRDKLNTIDRLIAKSFALERENETLKKELANLQTKKEREKENGKAKEQ